MSEAPPHAAPAAGPLDGRTILRFAHAFEAGGGTERYLDDLDGSLLGRSAATVIRVYIGADAGRMEERTVPLGRGLLVKVPLPLPAGESRQLAPDSEPAGTPWKHIVRNVVLYNPAVWRLFTRRRLLRWRLPRRPGQVVGAGDKVADLLLRHRVDLIMLHYFGGADADEIVREALAKRVPFALLNHYSNDRFLNLSIRKHALLASGISGVNGLGLPRYARNGFCNLSDGIDTGFFERSKAAAPAGAPPEPLILLPARVVRPKGHMDLIQAAAMIRRNGIPFAVGFAGRVESGLFVDELRARISHLGLSAHVHFLGELSVGALRDWYAASAVVAFPTYHHEGLGRVSLEAQAMHVPVVAYGTGGVAEGIDSGRTGYVVRKGDIGAMARRLGELLADPPGRIRMGAEGRRWVEGRFSLEALARRHEEFYLRVICSARKSAAGHAS